MIPNKQITKDEFFNIIAYQKLTSGGEATICESDTPFTMYKLFTERLTPIAMPKNKVKKISQLYEMQVNHSVHPLCTISLNDIIIGYEMTSDIGLRRINSFVLSPRERLYFLQKTKEILEYFESFKIIYGDIEPRNILYNRETGDIQFCDMDNITLDTLPMDLLPPTLQQYAATHQMDKNIHPYMHNRMTLRSYNVSTYTPHKKLRKVFKRPALKTIESMHDPKNFNNEYIVDYLKK